MMKALVLSADYPTLDGGVKLMYVHTRNLFYQHSGIDVTVLNFRASECYQIEGIPVISLEDYRRDRGTYDVLIAMRLISEIIIFFKAVSTTLCTHSIFLSWT